ncbi:YaaC family protein [Heyndrickxia sporothermodurans]|uniref:YaaC family protein n=1 Tax=Heyndrickxia sporothermodurans TaxID=46224 RepID=UPI00399C5917
MSNFSNNSEVIILQDIWQNLTYFHSAENARKFLHHCYKDSLYDKAEIKSYENCYPFIYYLQHGEIYYNQSSIAPMAIKPVLLFYGLIHLIKACLLTVDPNYPATTSVLAHGVSSRKRKKQQYQFINDEIKIQKLGLCTHFAKQMFHVERLDGEKIIMKNLLEQIPELDDYFLFNQQQNIFVVHKLDQTYKIPISILDKYHFTLDSFARFIEQKSCIEIQTVYTEGKNIMIQTNNNSRPLLPFRFHLFKQEYCLPFKQSKYINYPDLLVHYLLLYNLSMIARYETEWWCELLKTTPTNDYSLIKSFLSISAQKTPYLVYQYLREQR